MALMILKHLRKAMDWRRRHFHLDICNTASYYINHLFHSEIYFSSSDAKGVCKLLYCICGNCDSIYHGTSL